MPEFQVGDRVVYIRTNETGTVQLVHPAIDGRQQYTVSFPSGEARCLERYLERSVTIANPFDKCKRGMFGSCEDFTRINTTFKLEHTSNNTLSTLMASKTVFKAYQYKPLLKFLNSENRRILVADEVGLGKTIEAGHIMMELKARKEMRSALVICPHSLLDKWHDELEEKFGFDFKIYDDVQELIYDLKHRPEIVRGIINYEKVRLSRKDEEKLEEDKHSFEKLGISFEEKAFYDILVKIRDEKGFTADYPDDRCMDLAKKIKALVDNSTIYADFLNNTSLKSKLDFGLKLLLQRNGYPPRWNKETTDGVMEQVLNYKSHQTIIVQNTHVAGDWVQGDKYTGPVVKKVENGGIGIQENNG